MKRSAFLKIAYKIKTLFYFAAKIKIISKAYQWWPEYRDPQERLRNIWQ